MESHDAGTLVEPDNERPFSQIPPSLSIETVTLSAPTTVHETFTDGGGPTKLESGAAQAAAFDTEKLVMVCGGGFVAGGFVTGGFVTTGLAVVAGAVTVVAAVVVTLTVVVVEEVVVEPASLVVFDVELQPAASAPIANAATVGWSSLRNVVMDETLRMPTTYAS